MAGADLRPAFSSAQEAFGLPATVTRPAPDDDPIETTVVWLPPIPTDLGFDLQRQEPKRILCISRAHVPTLPRQTVIEAAEVLDGEVKAWRVDGIERYEFDAIRAFVIPDES